MDVTRWAAAIGLVGCTAGCTMRSSDEPVWWRGPPIVTEVAGQVVAVRLDGSDPEVLGPAGVTARRAPADGMLIASDQGLVLHSADGRTQTLLRLEDLPDDVTVTWDWRWSADGRSLCVTHRLGNHPAFDKLRLSDPEALAKLQQLQHTLYWAGVVDLDPSPRVTPLERPRDIPFDPTRIAVLAATDEGCTVLTGDTVWLGQRGRPASQVQTEGGQVQSWSDDGRWLVRYDGREGHVHTTLVDRRSPRRRALVDNPRTGTQTYATTALSSDGQHIGVARRVGSVDEPYWVTLEAADGQEIASIEGVSARYPPSLVWSPDATMLAVSNQEALWLLHTDGRVEQHAEPVRWAQWSPDGRALLWRDDNLLRALVPELGRIETLPTSARLWGPPWTWSDHP